MAPDRKQWRRIVDHLQPRRIIGFTGRDGTRETANPRHEPGDKSHPGIDRLKHH